ncbi:hypothetical protein A8W25_17060 [Streptomyces sp. ERV7]|nr:hypothetical protein A8W25_17060 [Streptomyces sp. ERV7]
MIRPPLIGSGSTASTSTPPSLERWVVTASIPRARNNSATRDSNSIGSIRKRSGSVDESAPWVITPVPTSVGRRTGRTAARWSGRADSWPRTASTRQSTALTCRRSRRWKEGRSTITEARTISARRPVAGSTSSTKPLSATDSSTPNSSAANRSRTTSSTLCASASRYSARRWDTGRADSRSSSVLATYRTDLAAGTTSKAGSSQSSTSCRAPRSYAQDSRRGKPSGHAEAAYRAAEKYSTTASGSPARRPLTRSDTPALCPLAAASRSCAQLSYRAR